MSVITGDDLLMDFIVSGSENDAVFALGNDDYVTTDGGNDTISGGDGNDMLFGGAGEDNISGGADNDIIFGGADNDTLNGGAGNDQLYGGPGADVLEGGTGEDVFNFDLDFAELDLIMDFKQGEDQIFVQGVGPGATFNYDAVSGIISVNGQDVAQIQQGLDPNSFNTTQGNDDLTIF